MCLYRIIKSAILFTCILLSISQEMIMADQTNSFSMDDPHLIVISAPSINNEYYKDYFKQLIAFDIAMVKAVSGRDSIVLLVDNDTKKVFEGKISEEIILEASVVDIWIRDFGIVIPKNPVKFIYRPSYLDKVISDIIDTSFNRFINQLGIKIKQSDIIMDGGNFADNGLNRAVLTERIFLDNPSFSKKELIEAIKSKTNLSEIAIIPEEQRDTTGHVDGMVMRVSESRLLVVDHFNEPFRKKVLSTLKSSLPGVEVIEIPNFPSSVMVDGFPSAAGIYVNSTITENYIYLPIFGKPEDKIMLKLIQSYTDKKVIPIYVADIVDLGGSVRCLSFQLKGKLAHKLITFARDQ